MRPVSHRDQLQDQRCGTCVFAHLIAYKDDLLCFHGDEIEVVGHSEYPVRADFVRMNNEEVGMLEGDKYDDVWAERVVNPDEVCDEWKQRPSE